MNASQDLTTFDQQVRAYIYNQVMKTSQIPSLAETAMALSCPLSAIQNSFQRLAQGRMIALQSETSEVLMANPFSAVPTPFLVHTNERFYYANCIWDALGIPAMLKQETVIETSCGDCGSAMILQVKDGKLQPAPGIVHFAISASHWWDDIVFN